MFVSTDNCSTWLKLVILHLPFSLREEKQDEDDIKVSNNDSNQVTMHKTADSAVLCIVSWFES